MAEEDNVEIYDSSPIVKITNQEEIVTVYDSCISTNEDSLEKQTCVDSSETIVVISDSVNSSVNGAVFITGVSPRVSGGNISNKVFEDGALKTFTTTTRDIVVSITAFTGNKTFKPIVSVLGKSVTLSSTGVTGIWSGSVDVVVPDDLNEIKASHSEGPVWSAIFDIEEVLSVSSAQFAGDYPGTQTELKENDSFNFYVQSNIPFFAIEIADFGAFKAQTITVSGVTEYTGIGVIANRGNIKTGFGFKVRIKSELGTWSDWFVCLDLVFLNNIKPSISVSVTYPNGQQAIKSGEFATLNITASNFDTFACGSSQLIVPNANLFESVKLLEMSLTTNYNISSNNVSVSLNREANNSTTTGSYLVKIVNTPANFSVSALSRLRSGGNFGTVQQTQTLYVSSNQPLISAPSFSAPSGSLSGSFSGAGSSWQTSITVHDDDEKGTFQLTDFTGYGLSKIPAVGSGQYTIGGFVKRILTIPAWPSRSSLIGTNVVDVSKLRCTNLSKGASGSLNFTYKSDTSEEVNKYTIIGLNEWYNCDGTNASSNTTGLMQIELEEIT